VSTPIPTTKRAKLVLFTLRERRLMREIEGIIANLDAEFEQVRGKAPYETFRGMLNTLRRDL
jgi:DNA-binding MarR family transcriptional regulator